MKERIQLSDTFTYRKLIRFTLPSICMMVFTSIYGVIDGLFVSNFVGKVPFAAINMVIPFLMILGVVGSMFGTGGSALVAKLIGEKNKKKANEVFSLIVYTAFLVGIALSCIAYVFVDDIVSLLGADGTLAENAASYTEILLISLPFFMLQYLFQALFITAEKPKLGFIVTVLAGCLNIVLDYLFIVVFDWGLEGAAWATLSSQVAGGMFPLFYFFADNDSLLRLTKTRFDFSALLKVCGNGASEFAQTVSGSLVSMLYNYQLIKYLGENGVAAFGVIMYVNYIFLSIYFGYALGISPVISYNYGAKNTKELKNVFNRSLIVIFGMSILLFVVAELSAYPLASVFVGYDSELCNLTKKAFMIYSVSFLLAGFNLFASSLFTALNNGLISAGIAFSRTLIFETSAVVLIPIVFGIDGIWSAIIFAEFAAMILSLICLKSNRRKYAF